MKKIICFLVAVTLVVFAFGCKPSSNGGSQSGSSGSSGTGGAHEHTYVLVKAVKPTCTKSGNSAYFICECGKVFLKKGTSYVETDMNSVTLKAKGHSFTEEVLSDEYLISEATETAPQTFAKACRLCGEKSPYEIDTFTYGKTLDEYNGAEKTLYTPTNLTMSLYDAANCVYGFTWNTETEPARPVVNITEKTSGEKKSVRASFSSASSYNISGGNETPIKYYSCKAEIELKPDTEYVYSVGDKYMETFTDSAEIKSVNPSKKVHGSLFTSAILRLKATCQTAVWEQERLFQAF